MKYEIEVLGKPIGKQRPRFGKNGAVYTPKETSSYENLIYTTFLAKYGKTKPFSEAVAMEIIIYVSLEKKHIGKRGINEEGKKKLSGEIRPQKKPDIDNIIKSCMDALNKISYRDDAQVAELVVKKYYTIGLPKVLITIHDI